MNFETKTQATQRLQAEAEARRAQVRANFQKSIPQEATLQFIVTSEQVGGPSKYPNNKGEGIDCPTYIVRAAPLAVENDPSSVQLQFEESMFITLPLRNLDVEGHTVGNSVTNDAARYFQALAPTRVQYVDKGTPGNWKNDPETKAARAAQENATVELAADLVSGDAKLEGAIFYADVKHKKSEKPGYRFNSMSASLLPGKEFSEPTEFTPTN